MKVLNIKSLGETPSPDILSPELSETSHTQQKKTYLDSIASEIVNEFVVNTAALKMKALRLNYKKNLKNLFSY